MLSLLAVGLVATSQAENEKIPELKTLSGKSYRDAVVTKVTPSEIRIIHESGTARILLKDLPGDLKAKFGYDPVKAEEFKKQDDARLAQNEAAAAKQEAAANQAALHQKKLKTAERRTFRVTQVTKTPNGLLANYYSEGGVASSPMGSFFGRSGSVTIEPSTGALVFLSGKIPPGIVDDAIIEATVVEAGIHEFITTAGSTSTVKKLEVLEMKLR